MAYLFFDTETTGLPDYSKPESWEGQPRIVQLGAILVDESFKVKSEVNLIIKPDGWTIPEAASNVHGITTADAEKYGVNIKAALNLFSKLLSMAECAVAHNITFDRYMVRREVMACGLPVDMFCYRGECTMKLSTDIVGLPPTQSMLDKCMTSPKPPSLQEAYKHFFGCEFEGAHDAMADVRACRDIYQQIQLKQAMAA